MLTCTGYTELAINVISSTWGDFKFMFIMNLHTPGKLSVHLCTTVVLVGASDHVIVSCTRNVSDSPDSNRLGASVRRQSSYIGQDNGSGI